MEKKSDIKNTILNTIGYFILGALGGLLVLVPGFVILSSNESDGASSLLMLSCIAVPILLIISAVIGAVLGRLIRKSWVAVIGGLIGSVLYLVVIVLFSLFGN